MHEATESVTSTETLDTPRIIASTAHIPPGQGNGLAFRGFQHIKADIRFSPDSENKTVCLDPGCLITLGDRALLRASVEGFDSLVRKQACPILVRGYGNKITSAIEYIVMDAYFSGTLEGEEALAKVPMEVHLTDDLKVNMLIGTDVLTLHKFRLDCES